MSLLLPPIRRIGFTLVEVLLSMAILTLLILLMTQLFNSAAALTTAGNRHMDADAQAREFLDRLAIDIGYMVKRPDVDYLLKDRTDTQSGNDQIAFYGEVPGYSSATPSSISLISYRLNPESIQAERLGKGLAWNGTSTTDIPMVFLPIKLKDNWKDALTKTAASDKDASWEAIGPEIFRFEYYYVLKTPSVPAGTTPPPAILSAVPWDDRDPAPKHDSVSGLRDVAAIGVAIAILDPRSRVIVTDAQLSNLAANLKDFDPSQTPGDLVTSWQSVIDSSNLPRTASSAVRLYTREFITVRPQ